MILPVNQERCTMFRIEFGRNEGPKWVPERVLEHDTFEEAKTKLVSISDELRLGDATPVHVKMFGPDDHLYHYITTQYPNISLPSQEK